MLVRTTIWLVVHQPAFPKSNGQSVPVSKAASSEEKGGGKKPKRGKDERRDWKSSMGAWLRILELRSSPSWRRPKLAVIPSGP